MSVKGKKKSGGGGGGMAAPPPEKKTGEDPMKSKEMQVRSGNMGTPFGS